MSNSIAFVICLSLIGTSLAFTATDETVDIDGFEIIGPCIDNACPLRYECKNELCILASETTASTLPTLADVPAGLFTEEGPISTDANPSNSSSTPISSTSSDSSSTSSFSTTTTDDSSSTPISSTPISSTSTSDSTTSTPTSSSSHGCRSRTSPSTTVSPESPSTDSSTPSLIISPTFISSDIPSSFTTNDLSSETEASTTFSLETASPSPASVLPSEFSSTTKSPFDFGTLCIFNLCPTGYECKNFWCTRPSSTVFPSTTTSPSFSSASSESTLSTTEEPFEITGPCIGNSCPDESSTCKNGYCVKSASAPGTCKDKRFGCALISYLCNIFTDLMTEDCAYTCKKC